MSRSAHISEREGPGEAGFTLLEVIIATLIVAVIAVATLTAFDTADRATSDGRAHAEAAACAQQDQERLRGLSETQLSALLTATSAGRPETRQVTQSCEPYAGAQAEGTQTVFTVTSSAAYRSETENAEPTCSSGDASDKYYLEAHTSVTWNGLGSRASVSESSIITTPRGASLLAKVASGTEAPVSGATITISGIEPKRSQVTSSVGCTLFGSLPNAMITATAARQGFVNVNGEASESKQATVFTNSSVSLPFVLAAAGSLAPEFVSNGTPVEGDTFVASQSGITKAPRFARGGVAGGYARSVTLGGLFPFATPGSHEPEPYTLYAGDCAANDPKMVSGIEDPKAVVLGEETTLLNTEHQALRLEEPPVQVTVYQGTSASPGPLANGATATISDPECEGVQAVNESAPGSTVHGQVIESEGHLKHPYAPYGTFALCISQKLVSGTKPYYVYKTTFANNTKTGAQIGTVYLEGEGTTSASGC